MLKKLPVVMLLAVGVLSSQQRFDLKVRNYFFAGFKGDAASLEQGSRSAKTRWQPIPKMPRHWSGTVLACSTRPVKPFKTAINRRAGNCGSVV